MNTGETDNFWIHESYYYDDMLYMWNKMKLNHLNDVVFLINLTQRLLVVIIRGRREMFFLLIVSPPLYQIPKINVYHKVASEHPEVIEGCSA